MAIAASEWFLVVQVSTDDLVDIINNSIITLGVVLPAVAVVAVALGYVALFWDVSRWWRAAVLFAFGALVCFGLAAVGGQVLRDIGIAAVLDAVNTPMLAAVTALPVTTALLAGGVGLASLAVAFALMAVVTEIR